MVSGGIEKAHCPLIRCENKDGWNATILHSRHRRRKQIPSVEYQISSRRRTYSVQSIDSAPLRYDDLIREQNTEW
jgi:hypothetical protein